MSWNMENLVDQFPALREKVFLDAACVSLTPRVAAEAISEFLQEAVYCPSRSATLHHIALDKAVDKARVEAARLVGAEEDEIALVESTTHGLSVVARALALKSTDNIVVGDLEFFQVPLAWRQDLCGQHPQFRIVKHQQGRFPVSAYADRIDEKTRAVVVSSVQWSNGFRVDLSELGRLCRSRNIYLVVDAIQQLGAFGLNVKETGVDFLVCGGHKWLNAPFGAGFLYIRKKLLEELTPPLSGYLALTPPPGGWEAHFQTPSINPFPSLNFTTTARRFENGGTGCYPAAAGLAASLAMINGLGNEAIEAKIRTLTDRLISGLQTLPVTLVTPTEPEHRSGIVTIGFGEDTEREIALKEFLLDHKILISVRFTSGIGGVRFSCHFFNSTEEIDKALNAVEDFAGKFKPPRRQGTKAPWRLGGSKDL